MIRSLIQKCSYFSDQRSFPDCQRVQLQCSKDSEIATAQADGNGRTMESEWAEKLQVYSLLYSLLISHLDLSYLQPKINYIQLKKLYAVTRQKTNKYFTSFDSDFQTKPLRSNRTVARARHTKFPSTTATTLSPTSN